MIVVNQLSKSFKLYKKPSDRLKELILRKPYHTRNTVLHDISFTVNDGEALAILGRNGAGKSTLLKLLTGIMLPDGGTCQLTGKITGLLELGTGFDTNLTGLQNIRTNGLLIGMTPEEVEERTESIIEFSELGQYIHEPIRTYSSGMVMRLAFSISIHANPDIFLIDEALSVGDGHFQQKCMRKIRQFRQQGGSIIFVSHDMNAVKMLCDRAIVLDEGRVVANAAPEQACNIYYQLIGGEDLEEENLRLSVDKGYGSFEAQILSAEMVGSDSKTMMISNGEEALLNVRIKANAQLDSLTLGFTIRDRFGQDMFGTNTFLMDQQIDIAEGEEKNLSFRMPMRLGPGKYTVSLALHENLDHTKECYHWWDNIAGFEVAGIRGTHFIGVCDLNPSCHIEDA